MTKVVNITVDSVKGKHTLDNQRRSANAESEREIVRYLGNFKRSAYIPQCSAIYHIIDFKRAWQLRHPNIAVQNCVVCMLLFINLFSLRTSEPFNWKDNFK
jgi:hypothetical protein